MNEFRSIGSFANSITRKNLDKSSCADVYSVTKYDGFVRSLDYFKKQVFSRDLSTYKIVRKGEFAYSTIHLDEGAIGLFNEDEALISPMYTVFKVDKSVDIFYLNHLLSSDLLLKKYGLIGQGSINRRKSISFSSFSELEVRIPSIGEQRRIAMILSGIDKEILNIRSKIKQIKNVSIAISRKLFKSIKGDLMPLSEVACNYDSLRVPIKSQDRAERIGQYRYFGASGVIDTIDDYIFDGDYILIGEDGANIIERNKPLVFKVSGKFWVNNHAHVIQPKGNCDINYLTHFLESIDYKSIAAGSAQPKITRNALELITVPIPPIELQKKIGAAIESTLNVVSQLERKKKKLVNMKLGISNDLFTGLKKVNI